MDQERRKHLRPDCHGFVELRMKDGEYRGAILAGVLMDISDGGVCVLLNGTVFSRGTAVDVELPDGLTLSSWVCHSTQADGLSRIGLSFTEVDSRLPNSCFNPTNCEALGYLQT